MKNRQPSILFSGSQRMLTSTFDQKTSTNPKQEQMYYGQSNMRTSWEETLKSSMSRSSLKSRIKLFKRLLIMLGKDVRKERYKSLGMGWNSWITITS